MTTPIRVPRLAVSMKEGTLSEWLVADGQWVDAGTPIYVLDTDKVDTEVESPASGTIRLLAAAGGVHPIGDLVAELEP